MNHTFPEDFIWGAASSAYQIEGYPLADGGGKSVWNDFCADPSHIADGESGEIACDGYHRFEEDIALLAGMGLKAYRFSTSWARWTHGEPASGTGQAWTTTTGWWTAVYATAWSPG